MTKSYWRERSAQVIVRVVADNPGLPEPELRKKISAAYPFGPRRYHPYAMWMSAVKRHFAPKASEAVAQRKPVPEGVCGHCEGAGCMFCLEAQSAN